MAESLVQHLSVLDAERNNVTVESGNESAQSVLPELGGELLVAFHKIWISLTSIPLYLNILSYLSVQIFL
jgi:hypothetical protein